MRDRIRALRSKKAAPLSSSRDAESSRRRRPRRPAKLRRASADAVAADAAPRALGPWTTGLDDTPSDEIEIDPDDEEAIGAAARNRQRGRRKQEGAHTTLSCRSSAEGAADEPQRAPRLTAWRRSRAAEEAGEAEGAAQARREGGRGEVLRLR